MKKYLGDTPKQYACRRLWGHSRYRNCSDVVPILEQFQRFLDNESSGEKTFVRLETGIEDGTWSCKVIWDHHDGEILETWVEHKQLNWAVYKCVADYLWSIDERRYDDRS